MVAAPWGFRKMRRKLKNKGSWKSCLKEGKNSSVDLFSSNHNSFCFRCHHGGACSKASWCEDVQIHSKTYSKLSQWISMLCELWFWTRLIQLFGVYRRKVSSIFQSSSFLLFLVMFAFFIALLKVPHQVMVSELAVVNELWQPLSSANDFSPYVINGWGLDGSSDLLMGVFLLELESCLVASTVRELLGLANWVDSSPVSCVEMPACLRNCQHRLC